MCQALKNIRYSSWLVHLLESIGINTSYRMHRSDVHWFLHPFSDGPTLHTNTSMYAHPTFGCVPSTDDIDLVSSRIVLVTNFGIYYYRYFQVIALFLSKSENSDWLLELKKKQLSSNKSVGFQAMKFAWSQMIYLAIVFLFLRGQGSEFSCSILDHATKIKVKR